MKKYVVFFVFVSFACAQSTVNGDRNFLGKVNATNATETQPAKTGPTADMPSSCNAGDQYFATDATEGKNLYICASANTWVQVSGTGAAGVNLQTASYAMAASDSGKLVVMNCNAACTLSFPAAPTNGYYSTVESIGSVIPVIALGTKKFNGSTSVPVLNNYRPLAFWSDGANFFGKAPVGAGTGINLSYATNGVTISATGSGSGWTIGPLSGLPPTPCAVGAAYFATDQPANQQLYTCSDANTWTPSMELGNSGALAVTGGALDITSTVPQKGTPNEWTALNTFDPGYVLKEQASGSTPATGFDMFYVKSTDHQLHMVNSAGTDTAIGNSSGSVAIEQGGVSQGSASTLNCSTNVTCTVAGSVATVTASGGGFTGTAGSIPFVGTGGSLTEDNTNLFWDATNNRLNLGGAQATEGGNLDTVTHLDVAGALRVVVDTGISLAGQGVLVCDTGNSCANFLLTGGGMTAIGRGAGAGTDIIAGDWNGNAFLGNVNSSSVANAEGSAAVSIMASENGHIYTHGSAPTLAGGGISALGIAVTHVGASVTSGSTAVTLSAANASIVVGQTISGADIAPGTTVSAISGTALTLSQAATGTNASETLGFATPESDNDSKGFVAFQSAGLAVLTFNTPWTSPPVCELTSGAPGSTVTAGSPSTTTLSIQLAGPTGSIDATVMYSCQGIK